MSAGVEDTHIAPGDPLREQPTQLQVVTDGLSILIAHCDNQTRYLFVNRAYATRFGRQPDELIGRTIASVLGEPAYAAIQPYVERALDGERVTFEITIPYEGLGPRLMRCVHVPQVGPAGSVDSFVASIVDVTEQRRSEETVRERDSQFRAAFEISAVGQVWLSAEGRFVLVNDKFCDISGYSRDELLLRGPADISHPEDVPRDVEHFRKLLSGAAPLDPHVKRYVRKDGQIVWVRVYATLLRGLAGEPHRIFAMVEDITDERRVTAEREAILAREQLARRAAEEASRTKDEFLGTLSHELRTPLNAILGWTQLLQRGVIAPHRQAAALEAIGRNASRQAQLVDDLLDLSRITAGRLKLALQPVSVAAIVDAAVDTVRPSASAKGILIVVHIGEPPVLVTGDPIRLQQVIWNLLSNAVKFTPEGGGIHVDATSDRTEVTIRVRDTGVGIDPAFVPRLFSRFEQADSSMTRTTGGLGLGLAIVRNIVELHGGKVSAESAGPAVRALRSSSRCQRAVRPWSLRSAPKSGHLRRRCRR